MTEQTKPTGLALLREPFPANQISKLPKESRAQIDERKANRQAGISCQICGSWHHRNAVHLAYVGHAALTDRLLDADPAWSWEPLSMSPDGLPVMDGYGGMWIKLTVCGVTRLGYGHAGEKNGGDAIKEVIGDALRNAAMRFGAALDLWHKGDLHGDDDSKADERKPEPRARMSEQAIADHKAAFDAAATIEALKEAGNKAYAIADSMGDEDAKAALHAHYTKVRAALSKRTREPA